MAAHESLKRRWRVIENIIRLLRKSVRGSVNMDRTSSFPKQDFEGMAAEIWQGLNVCLYYAAYVRIYADSTAMRLAGSRRRETIMQQISQTDRDHLQEGVIVFRAHFSGVLWQLHHLADELVRLAHKRCYQEGIVTKERYDALVKALDDDPIVEEIRAYRNLSHQFAGVIVTYHDQSDAFIAHAFPPLDGERPERNQAEVSRNEPGIQERELNAKLQAYCNHLGGYCEGLFRIIDAKYGKTALPRSRGFVVTIPHSYQGQLPEGATETIYVRVDGSTTP